MFSSEHQEMVGVWQHTLITASPLPHCDVINCNKSLAVDAPVASEHQLRTECIQHSFILITQKILQNAIFKMHLYLYAEIWKLVGSRVADWTVAMIPTQLRLLNELNVQSMIDIWCFRTLGYYYYQPKRHLWGFRTNTNIWLSSNLPVVNCSCCWRLLGL